MNIFLNQSMTTPLPSFRGTFNPNKESTKISISNKDVDINVDCLIQSCSNPNTGEIIKFLYNSVSNEKTPQAIGHSLGSVAVLYEKNGKLLLKI